MIAILQPRESVTGGYKTKLEEVKEKADDLAENFRSYFKNDGQFLNAIKNFKSVCDRYINLADSSERMRFMYHCDMFATVLQKDPSFLAIFRDTYMSLNTAEFRDISEYFERPDRSKLPEMAALETFVTYLCDLTCYRYLITESKTRGMVNYAAWTLSAVREGGILGVADNCLVINDCPDYDIGMDTANVPVRTLTLQCGPNSMHPGFHKELCQIMGQGNDQNYVTATYPVSANLNFNGAICQLILCNYRNRKVISSMTTYSKRSTVENPENVRYSDTWLISAFALAPNLLVRTSGATLKDQDYYTQYSDQINKIWDLREFNNDVYRFIVNGPESSKSILCPFPMSLVDLASNKPVAVSAYEELTNRILQNIVLGNVDGSKAMTTVEPLIKASAELIARTLPYSATVTGTFGKSAVETVKSEDVGIPLFMSYDDLFRESNLLK